MRTSTKYNTYKGPVQYEMGMPGQAAALEKRMKDL